VVAQGLAGGCHLQEFFQPGERGDSVTTWPMIFSLGEADGLALTIVMRR